MNGGLRGGLRQKDNSQKEKGAEDREKEREPGWLEVKEEQFHVRCVLYEIGSYKRAFNRKIKIY